MKFSIHGPYEVKRNGNLISRDKNDKSEFWEEVEADKEGLSGACGCYIFTIRDKAYYVGMAERQSFKHECFAAHKLLQYNYATQKITGRPKIIFIARLTPSGRFSKPSKAGYRDICILENMLIGLSLSKNPELQNAKGTKIFREMNVPGVLNTKPGQAKSGSVQSLKKALGTNS